MLSIDYCTGIIELQMIFLLKTTSFILCDLILSSVKYAVFMQCNTGGGISALLNEAYLYTKHSVKSCKLPESI